MTTHEIDVHAKQEVRDEPTWAGRTYEPGVDIYETSQSLWLWADMPGVDERSVDVRLADGVLTVEGRVSLEDYRSLQPQYCEYNVGNYRRRFAISDEIDAARIAGRLRDGVLEIELPKAERAKPRRISIATA